MPDPLETYFKLCLEAARECGPEPDVPSVANAIQRRVNALPPDERRDVELAVERLTSFQGPGFHEHGPH